MNKVYTSSQMEALCAELAKNLKGNKDNVFSQSMIITQGGGMNAWLTTSLAKANGIFAHFAFQNQDGFMGQVYELLTGQKLRSNRDAIKFGVYRLLDNENFKTAFSTVAAYYKGNDLRRIQLAEKIADLFDQYQLYREDMIKGWEDGKTSTEKPESENWQMWLWRELKLPSKATLRDDIYSKLELPKNRELLKKTWPEIHLFGISIMTNFHKAFYEKLAEYIPVNYYLCLPVQEPSFSNNLLESFGTKSKELLDAFAGMPTESLGIPDENSDTLLGQLLNSIRNNREFIGPEKPASKNPETDRGQTPTVETQFIASPKPDVENKPDAENVPDNSIQVSSHFTPVREVEALYNYLLDLFEKDSGAMSLKPRDVLVIAPDINTYEPFIKAVFRNAPVRLPIQVSGAANTTGDSITASLELLVNLDEDDLTSENVMGLLEQNRIRKAYQVENTAYVRTAVNKAGIRFGRENRLEDDSHYVSWRYGLERIILGYAMLTDEAFDVSHRLLGEGALTNYPFKDAEASASHDLLRLKAFVDDLHALFNAQQTTRTLADWKLLFLEQVMGKMVWSNDFDKKDREERAEIFKALGFTERLPEDVAAEEVPWEVFVNELKKRLFTESREHVLNTGAITFTSAIPARGLPYKVIAFIGLDNGVFPRQDRHLGFDLMGGDYVPGDRSKKEADKSLFIDTLMATREKLYLSYIGQSVKDNTEIPPSIVLDTLMDYLGMESVKHPLHGFSNKYDNEKLFTYLYNSKPESKVFDTKEKGRENDGALEEIWVNDFVKFFEAPIDWYFNKVLGINYDGGEDDILPETELFELDHLQQWKIKNKLLKYKGEISGFVRQEIQLGNLPLKNLGRATAEELSEKIAPLKQKYQELTNGKQEESVAIDITVDGIKITGIIDEVYGSQYITCNFSESKIQEKYQIRANLKSLLLCTSVKISNATQLNIDGAELEYPATDKQGALNKLKVLIKFLKDGKKAPLKFTLKALKAKKEKDSVTIESVLEQIKSEAEGVPNSKPPFPGNKYLQILLEENYFEDFSEEDLNKLKTLAGLLNLNVL